MKRQLNLLLILSLLFFNLQWMNTSVSAETSKTDFEIEKNSRGVTITKYNGASKTVDIPEKIDNEPVTIIGEKAFYNKGLTSVTIPNTVEFIWYDAFKKNNLTEVTIPNSVIQLEGGAFAENKLKKITIPNSVEYLGSSVFEFNELTEVTISNNVPELNFNVFAFNNIKKVTIPSSVEHIYESAFANNNLTEVAIPNSVKTIGEEAFAYNQLKSVTFNGSPTVNKTAFTPQNYEKIFSGWYTNNTYKTKWNNSVNTPMTIYAKWEPAIAAKNVTIQNNIGNDKIVFKNLVDDFTYTIYKDSKLTQKIKSFKATSSEKTISVKEIGDKAGYLYIVASKTGFPNKTVKVKFKAEPTPAISKNNVNAKYNKNQSTIKLTGLTKGAKYIIYKDTKKEKKIASFTATGKTKTIKTKQLSKKGGEVYITAQKTNYNVSALTIACYPKRTLCAKKPMPNGATIKEAEKTAVTYSYKKSLSNGNKITKVIVYTANGKVRVLMDVDGKSGGYIASKDAGKTAIGISFFVYPKITDSDYSILRTVATQFLNAYGYN